MVTYYTASKACKIEAGTISKNVTVDSKSGVVLYSCLLLLFRTSDMAQRWSCFVCIKKKPIH